MKKRSLPPPPPVVSSLNKAARVFRCSIFWGSVLLLAACREDVVEFVEAAEPTQAMVQALEDDGVVWDPDGFGLDLGIPYILRSAYACAEAVEVVGGLRNAVIRVYDSSDNELGFGTVDGEGRATVPLVRPLIKDEWIYAKQFGNNQVSERSQTRKVEEYEGPLPKPRVAENVWACSRKVGATGIVPGAKLIVEKNTAGNIMADDWPTAKYSDPRSWWPTPHNDLPLNALPAQVRVSQTYCPNMPNEMVGPASDWRAVQTAPSPMPSLDEPMSAVIGMDYIPVRGAYVGAKVTFYDGYVPKRYLHATYPNINAYGFGVIDGSMDLSVTQQLCGAESAPAYVDFLPESHLVNMVLAPEIVTPICPGARVFKVKTSVPGGQVIIYTSNNGYIARVAGSTSGAMVVLPSWAELQEDEEIEAIHVFPGVSSNYHSPTGYAQVGGGAGFEVLGASTYLDEFGAPSVSAFSRDESRGPVIALRCCASCDIGWPDDDDIGQCLLDDPRTATARILYKGEPIDEVTLYEEYYGYFVGQWDWYQESGEGGDAWPPAANIPTRKHEDYEPYEVVIYDSPCDSGSTRISTAIPFDVLISQPNVDDESLPEEIYFRVGSAWTNVLDKSEVISPGKNITVSAEGFDFDGLKRLEVKSASPRLKSPKFVEVDMNFPPLKSELSLQTSLEYLDPYESVMLYAEATNFGNGVRKSGEITVTALHPTPSISSVSPLQMFASDTFTINGSHLSYSTLETIVHFELSVAGGGKLTDSQIIQASNATASKLSNVSIPQSMQDKKGTVEVWVVTKNKNGVEEKQSSRKSFELKKYREQGAFTNFNLTDFEQNKFSHCTSSNVSPGVITGVTLYPGGSSGSVNDVVVSIQSNGRVGTVNTGYNTDSGFIDGMPHSGFAGIVIGPKCRTMAVLSYTKGTSSPKRYDMHFYYFPPSGNVVLRNHGATSLYRVTNQSFEIVPRIFRVSMSPDETVVSVGTPNSMEISDGTNIKYAGKIRDLLTDRSSSNALGACSTSSLCSWETTIADGEVTLKLDGNQVASLSDVVE